MRPREHRLRRAASAAPQGRMKYRATATHALPARSAVAALSVLRGPPNRTLACESRVVYPESSASVLRGRVCRLFLRHHVKEEILQTLYDLGAFTSVATTHELDEITPQQTLRVA
jgi:hypothetical protein